MRINVIYTIAFLLSLLSCKETSYKDYAYNDNIDWDDTKAYYETALEKAIDLLDTLALQSEAASAKKIFTNVRIEFKKAEAYGAYLNPEIGHRANGPALPVFAEDSERVLPPMGLQKLEESIYEGELTTDFVNDVEITVGLLKNLLGYIKTKELTPQRFFISTHEQLLRIISFSISGFDTPVSQTGLNEAIVSLQSLKEA